MVADALYAPMREVTMTWAKVAIYLSLGVVFAFVSYLVFRPTHDSVCLALLPLQVKTGLGIDGTTIKVDIGAVQKSSGASPEQAASFIECLKRENPAARVETTNGVLIPRLPAGELSDNWHSEQGLQVSLEPEPGAPEKNKVLQNLSIGPAAGTKAAVIGSWCKAAQACVTCDPQAITDATNQIIVRLKQDALYDKRQMEGTYPPSPANPHKPWEDVNEKGERFYYECKPAAGR
jgi:hypothetical protein